ncbi:hypothetical protein TPY_0469 [Sulfobacillus acidophilus TPY]|nr:hypothetical protein TPY_0469 [Sulfobacillus acidophilus TPY]
MAIYRRVTQPIMIKTAMVINASKIRCMRNVTALSRFSRCH